MLQLSHKTCLHTQLYTYTYVIEFFNSHDYNGSRGIKHFMYLKSELIIKWLVHTTSLSRHICSVTCTVHNKHAYILSYMHVGTVCMHRYCTFVIMGCQLILLCKHHCLSINIGCGTSTMGAYLHLPPAHLPAYPPVI